MLRKRGDLTWGFIAKLLFIAMILAVLLFIIGKIFDKSFGLVNALKDMLGF